MTSTEPRISGELTPTATYSQRRWYWEAVEGILDQQHVGRLTIVQHKAKGRAVECEEYNVFRTAANRYELLKSDGSQEEAYLVWLQGKAWVCNCKAAKCRLHCKHREAMAAFASRSVGSTEYELPECFRGLPPSGRILNDCPF